MGKICAHGHTGKAEIQIALGKQLSGLKVQEKMIEDAISVLAREKEKPPSGRKRELKNLVQFFCGKLLNLC